MFTSTCTITRQELFNRNFNAIQQCIDESGKLNLPRDNNESTRLATWAHRQLQKTTVPADQRDQIETLRRLFDNRPRREHYHKIWHQFLEELTCYKEEFHTFVISKKDGKHKKLSNWVARQRKLARNGQLSAEKRQALEAIGYDLPDIDDSSTEKKQFTKEQEAKWEALYEKLTEYKAQHGHCKVAYYDTKNLELARWVSLQRVTRNKGRMSENRELRLNELGFVWQGKKNKCNLGEGC